VFRTIKTWVLALFWKAEFVKNTLIIKTISRKFIIHPRDIKRVSSESILKDRVQIKIKTINNIIISSPLSEKLGKALKKRLKTFIEIDV
jgi:hypothetical protein